MKTRYYTIVSYWPQVDGSIYRSERKNPWGGPILYGTKKSAIAQMREYESNGAICHLGFVNIDYPKAPKRSDFK